MDEQRFWGDQLTRAAETDRGATEFDVADDLARGRRRLRRRQGVVAGAAGLALTTVVGTTLLVSSFGVTPQGVPAPAGPGEPSPTFQEPSPTSEPTPSPSTPSRGPGQEDPFAQVRTTKEWRTGIYEITASALDPEKRYLNYSTQSLQSGSMSEGGIHMGIKMGWSVPGRPGEGLVQISISTERRQDVIGCMEYVGSPCRRVIAKTGLEYEIGRGGDGEFVVMHEQPDGERVVVYVNPLFGNNAVVPVAGMTVTERDVLRLVQDERLDLPSR